MPDLPPSHFGGGDPFPSVLVACMLIGCIKAMLPLKKRLFLGVRLMRVLEHWNR